MAIWAFDGFDVVVDGGGVECGHEVGDAGADAAQAEDAEGLVGELSI